MPPTSCAVIPRCGRRGTVPPESREISARGSNRKVFEAHLRATQPLAASAGRSRSASLSRLCHAVSQVTASVIPGFCIAKCQHSEAIPVRLGDWTSACRLRRKLPLCSGRAVSAQCQQCSDSGVSPSVPAGWSQRCGCDRRGGAFESASAGQKPSPLASASFKCLTNNCENGLPYVPVPRDLGGTRRRLGTAAGMTDHCTGSRERGSTRRPRRGAC